MDYELKELTSDNIFDLCDVIGAIGIENIQEAFKKVDVKKLVDDSGNVNKDELSGIVGINFAISIGAFLISNLSKCKKEMYKFLSSISNLSSDEIAKQKPVTTMKMINDIVKKEEFKDFFMEASKLFK